MLASWSGSALGEMDERLVWSLVSKRQRENQEKASFLYWPGEYLDHFDVRRFFRRIGSPLR
jgi:hypothetical protein